MTRTSIRRKHRERHWGSHLKTVILFKFTFFSLIGFFCTIQIVKLTQETGLSECKPSGELGQCRWVQARVLMILRSLPL